MTFPTWFLLLSPTGVEPVTFGFGGQRSIQLSYGDIRVIPVIRKDFRPLQSGQQGQTGIKTGIKRASNGHQTGINENQWRIRRIYSLYMAHYHKRSNVKSTFFPPSGIGLTNMDDLD
jgi:hypothetical protein